VFTGCWPQAGSPPGSHCLAVPSRRALPSLELPWSEAIARGPFLPPGLVLPTVVAPAPAFFAGRLPLFVGRCDVMSPAGGCPTHRGRKEGLFAVRDGVPLSRML